MNDKDGGPAFPIPHQIIDANDPMFKLGYKGASIRDVFAVVTMLGMSSQGFREPSDIASRAYKVADAMLAARNAKP